MFVFASVVVLVCQVAVLVCQVAVLVCRVPVLVSCEAVLRVYFFYDDIERQQRGHTESQLLMNFSDMGRFRWVI